MAQATPRFRRDLVASSTEADGVAFVDVQDPRNGTSFRLYDFEYQLALQLNGQPLEEIVSWANSAYGLDLTADGISEFATKLDELGFLQRAPAEAAAPPLPPAEPPPAPLAVVAASVSEVPSAAALAALDSIDVPTPGPTPGPARAGDDLAMPPLASPPAASTPPPLVGKAAGAAPAAARKKSEPSLVTELPADELEEVPDSGPAGASRAGASSRAPAAAAPASKADWSVDLGGMFGEASSSAAPSGSASAAETARVPSSHGGARGTTERRPAASFDAAVSAPFPEEVSRGRFTAPPPARGGRRGPAVVIALLVAAGGAGYYVWARRHPPEPQALRVRVVSPKPTAVYRWFSTAGAVVNLEARPLYFEGSGKLKDLLPAGTSFAARDILGKLEGAAAEAADLARLQARVTALTQARDSLKASGNKSELRKAESKLAERKKLLAETQATVDRLTLRAPEPGQITETLVRAGSTVAARAPVLRWKAQLLHGDFTMDDEDFSVARKLEFCRIEVTGPVTGAGGAPGASASNDNPDGPRFVECKLPPQLPVVSPSARGASPLHKFIVGLPPEAGLATGQPLRLARLRYEGVFPLPPSAIVHADGDKVWVIAASGVAELRSVSVVESREEVLVAQGLAPGDQVIVDPPAGLQEGARVAPQP